MGKYLNYLINEKLDCILIFSSTGLSFLEKGLMAKIGSLVGIPVYFCPRSGNMNKLMDSSYFFRSFAQWVFRGCEQVVCQSDSWRVYYQEVTSLPDEQFTVIPNWIDTSRYPGKQFTGGESRLKCLFMSSLLEKKGVHDLIEAISLRKNELKDVDFVFAGEGPERDHLIELAHDRNIEAQVQFLGWIGGEEKIESLSKSDIFVLPSYEEGMPNALLEAMASGCACIATRVGGCPDMIPDNRFGLLITPGDVKSLSDALVDLASNHVKRQVIGAAARKRVLQYNDIVKASEKFWKIFNGVRENQ